jgi:hypothetical protein
MNQPTLLGKLLSPAGFGVVLLMFFLPFVAVSCGTDPNHRVTATFTGMDMITAGAPSISGPDVTADDQASLSGAFADQYDNEPLAILAAAVILGAMGTVLLRDWRTRHATAAVLAVVSAGLLAAAEIRSIGRLNHIQLHGGDGSVTDLNPVSAWPRIGFYLAIGVLVCLVVGHAVTLFRRPVNAGPPLPTGPPGQVPQSTEQWARPIWDPLDPEDLEDADEYDEATVPIEDPRDNPRRDGHPTGPSSPGQPP